MNRFTTETARAAARKRVGTAEARFWKRVVKTDGCWLWMGKRNQRGYGEFVVGGRVIQAHRFSYELVNGPIAPGLLACHHCDVPYCVKPRHLFLGTYADNARDRNTKGRNSPRTGTNNGRARLTPEQVDLIRVGYRAGALQRELARRFGVDQTQISRIVRGERWCA